MCILEFVERNKIESHHRNGGSLFAEVFMLRIPKIFILTFVIIILSNCGQNKNESPPISKPIFEKCEMSLINPELIWHDSDIVSCKYTCYIPNENYESFSFGKDSLVSAEIGCLEKELMAPLYYWHIDSSGALIIGTGKNDIHYKLIKLSVNDSSVIACSNGFVKTYKFIRRKRL